MTCEEVAQTVLRAPMAATESSQYGWTEKRRRRRIARPKLQASPEKQLSQVATKRVISGMLPTLQTLSSLNCDEAAEVHELGVCLIPQESSADAASHLQTTLLEAYCREIGLKLFKLPMSMLTETFGNEHRDLSCVLVVLQNDSDANYFLASPD